MIGWVEIRQNDWRDDYMRYTVRVDGTAVHTVDYTDGLPHDVRPHPRLWGAFPRVLASYWREKQLMSMEQAVHKMTGLSARRFRIPDRGVLREGAHADVVVFDPARVRDRASFEDPIQFSEGIEHVFVNGVLSYTETGRGTNARAGRFVRRG